MKKTFGKLILAESLILIAALVLLCMNAFGSRERKADIVTINDYIQTAKEHWEDGNFEKTSLARTQIMILSEDGSVLYQTDETVFEGIRSQYDALRKEMLCTSVTDGDRFLGTVVVPNPVTKEYASLRSALLWITALVMALIVIAQVIFLWYVRQNVVRPFERMREFAARVARGELDEPLLMEKNNLFGLFTESFDLMRDQLRESKKREIALKLKEKELIASLSHDLQSPVTGIKLICEILEVKVQDEYLKGKITTIDHKTEEIRVLLNNLLNSALDDLSEMNVSCKEESSKVLEELLEEHDPHKLVKAQEAPECLLMIDRARVSQIIGNIIGNSYKYANTRIDVNYRFREQFLEMEIRDHGEGVAEEELPLVTGKFYRGKNTAGKEGSGLGLYISGKLMEKMNGELICRGGREGFCVALLFQLA